VLLATAATLQQRVKWVPAQTRRKVTVVHWLLGKLVVAVRVRYVVTPVAGRRFLALTNARKSVCTCGCVSTSLGLNTRECLSLKKLQFLFIFSRNKRNIMILSYSSCTWLQNRLLL